MTRFPASDPTAMKRLSVLLACFLVAMPAIGDVYTWRDENGVLHYGDLPKDDSATRVPIATRRTDNTAVQTRAAARQDALAASSEAFQDAESAAAAAEEAARLASEEKAAACTKARERLRNYINARRLYRTNEAGEREYLDSNEITAARSNAEQDVADKCRG